MSSATPLPRGEFAVTQEYAYFNHAAVGTLSRRGVDAIEEFVRAHARAGVLGTHPYDDRMPAYRDRIGKYIGASGAEIAILSSTSTAANAVALGVRWNEGDEVLLCDNEFPSNAVPWVALRARGVRVRLLPAERERLTPEVLRREIGPRTRVVAVSWVSYADGYRHDLAGLAEVAHAAGALLCVDAIQALGAFTLDVRALGVDALYAGAGKWMLGLHGAALLYVRSGLLEEFALAAPGWRSLADMWNFHDYTQAYAAQAMRFEGGTPNFIGALALERSIDLFESCGTRAIEAHVLALTGRLCEGLNRAGAEIVSHRSPEASSGIVTFRMPGCDSVALGRELQRQGIVTTYRPGGVRVAPHGYNSDEEIDRLLETLVPAASARG